MDHMMPKKDGVETTQDLRAMGYDRPIVALTANAVSGEADKFLKNGFNDYIAKPIDLRQLNNILNKLIRDKQPPEVVDAARKQADNKKESLAESKIQQTIDKGFAEIFVRDAVKSLAALDEIIKKGIYDEEELRTYVINVHGMKSTLANIGKMDVSAVALKLENLGRDKNVEAIKSETPAFLNSLREVIIELTPEEDVKSTTAVDEDPKHLHEKLVEIKAACEEYAETTIEQIILKLKEKSWSVLTNELLNTIAEHLLHSDFDEILDAVNNFIETL
jgi:CheY-like chemotaxis protein